MKIREEFSTKFLIALLLQILTGKDPQILKIVKLRRYVQILRNLFSPRKFILKI